MFPMATSDLEITAIIIIIEEIIIMLIDNKARTIKVLTGERSDTSQSSNGQTQGWSQRQENGNSRPNEQSNSVVPNNGVTRAN